MKGTNYMKGTIIFLLVLLATTGISFSATHTITNSGFSFSPSSITINIGDTVKFVLESIHDAREVNQATWNANGTTSNGGFDLPFGGGTVVLTQTGIHYYVCVPHASIGMKGTITVNSATGVKTISETIPDNFILMQNYPNPFNPSTAISFDLARTARVSLKVYNVLGQLVATLLDDVKQPGSYKVSFNAATLGSGMYFYRLLTDAGFSESRKMLVVK
jgi:plastocyanin